MTTITGETTPVERAQQLAVTERSGFVESRHTGSAILLAPDGTVLRSLGDPRAALLPRSALKPFQALAALTAGVPLADAALAVAAGSHSGTAWHRRAVLGILAAAGLDETALGCPPAWPLDGPSRREAITTGTGRTALAHQCSGKHAAMVAACVAQGWPGEGYLQPTHPVQLHERDVIERLSGEKVTHVAVDGCGAPAFAITLTGLARALQRMATASGSSPFALHAQAARVVAAMREHPWAVAGPGRPDTLAAEDLGILAKSGAEGVFVAACPDGTTLALKVLDGSGQAAAVAGLGLLADAGAVEPETAADLAARLGPVRGGGEVVGRLTATVATR